MDLLVIVFSGVMGPAVVFGVYHLWRSLGLGVGFSRRPGPEEPPERSLVAGVDARFSERLVKRPPLVTLPVTLLAGLPISRPVIEGWRGRRKRRRGVVRRRAVQRIVSSECRACGENRAQGRNYCRDCARRLTPFLAPVGPSRLAG